MSKIWVKLQYHKIGHATYYERRSFQNDWNFVKFWKQL